MHMKTPILRVAVGTPLHRCFDYLTPRGTDSTQLHAGQRVRVPFGRRSTVGVLVDVATHSDIPPGKLRRATALLDDAAVLEPDILAMVIWASHYYHYPIGEAISTALPVLLRQGADPHAAAEVYYRLTPAGRAADPATLSRD